MVNPKDGKWTQEKALRELTRLGNKRVKMETRIAEDRENMHEEIQSVINETAGLDIPRAKLHEALQVSRGRLYDRYLVNIPQAN
jgi:hypothetical protein